MKNNLKLFGIIAAAAVVGLSVSGCATPLGSERVTWANAESTAVKDFEAVGIIVLRNVDAKTVSADLMDAAKAMGGDDIINVRFDMAYFPIISLFKGTINTASAVAIKYTGAIITAPVY